MVFEDGCVEIRLDMVIGRKTIEKKGGSRIKERKITKGGGGELYYKIVMYKE